MTPEPSAFRSGFRILVLSLFAAGVAGGCAGKPSARGQYDKRVREIGEKYDAMLVNPEDPPLVTKASSCDEFLSKLQSAYKLWKPGAAGEAFCARGPKARDKRDFEAHVRAIHNKGVAMARAKRLAHLKEQYEVEVAAEDKKNAEGTGRSKKKAAAPAEPDTGGAEFDFATAPVEDAPAPRVSAPARPQRAAPVAPVARRHVPAPALVDPNDPDQLPYSEEAEAAQAPAPAPAPPVTHRAQHVRSVAPKVEAVEPPERGSEAREYQEGSASDSAVLEYQ